MQKARWTLSFHTNRVEASLLALPDGLLARFVRYAEAMERHGPDLRFPHTRAMGDGLFELRLRSAEGAARVLYCVLPERRIRILHCFVKKSQRTPRTDLDLARRRLKEA